MIRTIFLSIIFLILSIGYSHGQGSKFKRAEKSYFNLAYLDALDAYLDLVDEEGYEYKAAKRVADIYRLTDQPQKAEAYYRNIVYMEEVQPEDMLHYAQVLQSNQKYSEADLWMQKYQNETGRMPGELNQPLENYVDELKRDSSNYQITKVNFNSEYSDFSPMFYEDLLLFISDRKDRAPVKRTYSWNGHPFLDIYYVDPNVGGKASKLFPGKINGKYHEGPVSFTPDGSKMYFTRNNTQRNKIRRGSSGYSNLKIYFRERTEKGTWSKEKELPINSDDFSTGHPSVSPDGRYLYFASDRPGGFGGTDIYRLFLGDTLLSTPENLGAIVNTSQDEMFPFISEMENLYFASNGHSGLGDLDIFVTDKDGLGKPINMGYPLNSPYDDFGLILDSTDTEGYFSSNRPGGKGDDDIYSVYISSKISRSFVVKGNVISLEDGRPVDDARVRLLTPGGSLIKDQEVTRAGFYEFDIEQDKAYKIEVIADGYQNEMASLSTRGMEGSSTITRDFLLPESQKLVGYGEVFDAGNFNIIPGVILRLTDLDKGKKQFTETSSEGYFEFNLLPDSRYQLSFEKGEYFSKTLEFETGSESSGRFDVGEVMDLGLTKIELGKAIRLDNIYYDLGKAEIRPDAAQELNKLVKLLRENPSIEIELSSHTDSRGSDGFNMSLSQRRAQSARDYIVSQGIDASRVAGRGYGETQLVNRCSNGVKCSDFEHQQNRRTEFKVTKQ